MSLVRIVADRPYGQPVAVGHGVADHGAAVGAVAMRLACRGVDPDLVRAGMRTAAVVVVEGPVAGAGDVVHARGPLSFDWDVDWDGDYETG